MMLGEPIADIAEPIDMARQVDAPGSRLLGRLGLVTSRAAPPVAATVRMRPSPASVQPTKTTLRPSRDQLGNNSKPSVPLVANSVTKPASLRPWRK